MLRPPYTYQGGKILHVDQIVPRLPENIEFYGEVFGGSGAVLLNKPRSPVEAFNDLHSGIHAFWRVLRSDALTARLKEKLDRTPYSRKLYEDTKEWHEEDDFFLRAYKWYCHITMSFSGREEAGFRSPNNGDSYRDIAQLWRNRFKRLPAIQQRIENVVVENLDGPHFMEKYDGQGAFFYLDPPYVQGTRDHKSTVYVEEMDNEDHKNLIDQVRNLEARVMISGYNHEIYAPLVEEGWNRQTYQAFEGMGPGHYNETEESLWMNYEPSNVQKSLL